MDLDIATLADRPERADLIDQLDDPGVAPFLYQDAVSVALFADLVHRHPAYTLLAVEANGRPAAMVCTMPFTHGPDLPPGGYDAVLLTAAAEAAAGRTGPHVSALFATVRPDLRGRGLSTTMVDAARRNAAALGHTTLLAPVRPTQKHRYPHMPMAEYARRRTADGRLEDPWLRVHESLGGRYVGVAPHSMTVTADLALWRTWTGLAFDTAGAVVVPGGLVPAWCDVEHGIATYVEPNVWYRHDLTAA